MKALLVIDVQEDYVGESAAYNKRFGYYYVYTAVLLDRLALTSYTMCS